MHRVVGAGTAHMQDLRAAAGPSDAAQAGGAELREIRRMHQGRRWRLEFDAVTPAARDVVDRGRFSSTTPLENGWELELIDNRDARDLLSAVSTVDASLVRFEHVQPTLHDIFVEKVGSAAANPRQREASHA